jgi:hypothetical protein
MADGFPNQQGVQSSISGRRRLGGHKWEPFRLEIEELYVEHNYSRRDIVEKLRQDGFPVT